MSFGNEAGTIRTQVGITQELKTHGFAGFAYSSLFDRRDGHKPRPLADALVQSLMPGTADTPWKDSR